MSDPKQDEMRVQFEALAKAANIGDTLRDTQAGYEAHYSNSDTQAAWVAYQAAYRAATERAAQVCREMHEEDRPSDYAYAILADAGIKGDGR